MFLSHSFTTRKAQTDVEICGIKYPAGLSFYFPTKQIHLDPENWDNPLTFDPDRFLKPLKHPLAYQVCRNNTASYELFSSEIVDHPPLNLTINSQPFGDGPRNCIGMRPALLFVKLALCKIIPKFHFTATEEPNIKGVMIVSQPDRIMAIVQRIKP